MYTKCTGKSHQSQHLTLNPTLNPTLNLILNLALNLALNLTVNLNIDLKIFPEFQQVLILSVNFRDRFRARFLEKNQSTVTHTNDAMLCSGIFPENELVLRFGFFQRFANKG